MTQDVHNGKHVKYTHGYELIKTHCAM